MKELTAEQKYFFDYNAQCYCLDNVSHERERETKATYHTMKIGRAIHSLNGRTNCQWFIDGVWGIKLHSLCLFPDCSAKCSYLSTAGRADIK